jgi:predicted DNA-binding transcriptional regulator YafY
MSKTARWLDLIAYLLQHRYPVTREQVFESVTGYLDEDARDEATAHESARRKFERDKDELRSLGINIETVKLPQAAGDEAGKGYLLKERDFYLPYLELVQEEGTPAAELRSPEQPYRGLRRLSVSRAELDLLDRATRRLAEREELPLAAAARSARRKLAFDLPVPLRAVEKALAKPLSDDARKSLEVLQTAVAEHTAVACRYYSITRDSEADREIEPYGLFFGWSRWYCVARARDRDAMRVFRVDRMRDATLLKGEGARFEVPKGFSIRSYLGRAPWELSDNDPTPARVRFRFPDSRWVQAQGLGEPEEPLLEDGGAILRFGVRDRNPFLRWLLTFRQQAELLEPEELAGELDGLRQRVAALYAEKR